MLQKEGLNIGYIAFNVEKKPFDDKRVRQALNLATNKEAILKAVYQGNGQVAKNPIPPILWGYNDAVKDYPYDPAKAKELLAQAGFPNGFEVELWYLPVTRPYNPDGKRMAEMIQADWEKIGVKAKLVTFEWAEYRKRAKGGEHQVRHVRLVGRQRRSGQLLRAAAGLRGRQGRRQQRALVQQGLRGPDHQGGADAQAGRPRQALRAGAGDRSRKRRPGSPSRIRSASTRCARRSRATRWTRPRTTTSTRRTSPSKPPGLVIAPAAIPAARRESGGRRWPLVARRAHRERITT